MAPSLENFPTENSIAIDAAKLYDIYIKKSNIKTYGYVKADYGRF